MVHYYFLFYLQKPVSLRFWKVLGVSFHGYPIVQTKTETVKFWEIIPVFEGLVRSVDFQPIDGQPATICAFRNRSRLTQTLQVTPVRTFIKLFQIFAGFAVFAGFWNLIRLLVIN